MNQEISLNEKVAGFVSSELEVASERLSGNPSLFHDLNVDGDDGIEFMLAFAKQFHVDIAQFEPSLHFGPEASATPWFIFTWFLFPKHRPKFIPIRITDLIDAAINGIWKTPNRPAA